VPSTFIASPGLTSEIGSSFRTVLILTEDVLASVSNVEVLESGTHFPSFNSSSALHSIGTHFPSFNSSSALHSIGTHFPSFNSSSALHSSGTHFPSFNSSSALHVLSDVLSSVSFLSSASSAEFFSSSSAEFFSSSSPESFSLSSESEDCANTL
jgi:hypothetical protein